MQALSNLQDPDRERRRQAAEGVTAALEPGLRTRAFVTNTLAADKATKDRLRHYDHWLASRNLSNEASDESVEALIAAVQDRYDLARRWYRLKAKILGLDRLAHYDRMAPLRESTDRIPYGEAQELVLDCYRGFSPELGEAAAELLLRTATSTARPSPASAAARSAPTPCPAPTPTCCSTTPRAQATC